MGILRGIRMGMLAAQGSGAALSPSQIAAYAAAAGFTGDDLNTAVGIAYAESSGIPTLVGDKTLAPTKGPSYGLWQINIGSKANPQFASWNLLDPQTNANAAYAIYSAWGNMFGAWTTFTDGAYLAYVPASTPDASQPAQPALTLDAATGQPVTDLTDVSQLVPASLVASTSDSTIIPGIPDVAIYGGAALAALLGAKFFLDRD